jgi:glycosyltransferase involved in cell wall biosynthesis
MTDEYEKNLKSGNPNLKFKRNEILATFTGKPVETGGSLGREEATGRGGAYVLQAVLAKQISNIPSARAQGEGKYQISKPKKYFLYVGRLARAKNIHLAIEACNKLGCQLWVVGAGREENDLKSIAGPTIKFLGQVSDKGLPEIYQGAKALIFPAEDEEFGIVPVEAMAHGLPVIALRSGGVVESVVDSSTSSEQGATGIFFDKPTVESLAKAIKSLDRLMVKPEDCKKQAKKFSKTIFKKKITDFVEEKLKEHHARIT